MIYGLAFHLHPDPNPGKVAAEVSFLSRSTAKENIVYFLPATRFDTQNAAIANNFLE